MNRRTIYAVIAGLAIGAAVLGYAADSEAQMGDPKSQQGARDKPGMQGIQGMHEMMGMMRACPMMGGGGMMGHGTSALMMPQLPPGNEKVQLQMWAEMMQKMGEIAGKYAAQVK